jgi:hypothetical protein
MNTSEIAKPTSTVASAGTIHGTASYWPVQPSQRQPTTSAGAAIIAPVRRASGGGKPRHFAESAGYERESHQFAIEPSVVPMPTPMNTSDACVRLKPCVPMKMTGSASKSLRRCEWCGVGKLMRGRTRRADRR